MLQFLGPLGLTALRGIGSFAAKQAVKRAPKTARKVQQQYKKTRTKVDPVIAKAKETAVPRFLRGKNIKTGKTLSAKPTMTPLGQGGKEQLSFIGGRAVDTALLGGTGLGAYETGKAVSPLFTDEDFTKSDALMLASGIVAANPALKFGRRALSRLTGFPEKGVISKKRLKIDPKTGKPVTIAGKKQYERDPVTGKIIEDKTIKGASPLERRKELVAAGASVPLAVAAGITEPDKRKLTSLTDLSDDMDRSEQDQLFVDQAIKPQVGPNVQEVIDKVEKRGKGTYSEDQVRQMLEEAKERDDTIAAESIPDSTETPKEIEEEVKKDEEKLTDPPVSVAPNEIDMNKNPGQAVEDADTAAKEKLFTTPENPSGNPSIITMPKDFYKDGTLHSLMAAANQKTRDYTGMNEAMEDYKNFIADEKSKTLSYDQYKAKFAEITGDSNEDSANLAMFKWAMAMMTGRSNQNGLSGFLDIAGDAGMVYADDLAAIHAQDRQEKLAIANSFMAYEQDAKKYLSSLEQGRLSQIITNERQLIEDKVVDEQQLFNNMSNLYQLYLNKMQILQEIQDKKNNSLAAPRKVQEYVMVDDPTALFGRRRVRLGYTAEGKRVKFEFDKDGNEIIVPIGPEDAQGTELGKTLDTARLNKDLNNLIAMNQGLRFTDIVLESQDMIGSKGAVKSVLLNLGGLYRDWKGTASGSIPTSAADFDSDIQQMLFSSSQLGTGARTDADDKEYNRLMKTFNKDRARIKEEMREIEEKGIKSKYISDEGRRQIQAAGSEDERKQVIKDLALLRLIQNRMKYIVANANKGEDRLTVADVDDARSGTEIIAFFKSSETVIGDYSALKGELNNKFKSLGEKYIGMGGDVQQLLRLDYADEIKKYKAGLRSEAEKQKDQQNQQLSIDQLIGKLGY